MNGNNRAILERKAKGTCNPKSPGSRIVQIITPKIKIDPEDPEDIPDANTPLPVDVLGRLVKNIRSVNGPGLVADLPIDRSKPYNLS